MPNPARPLVTTIAIGLLASSAGGQDPGPAPDLPTPFQVEMEQAEAGNPLARYVELGKMRARYLESPMWEGIYPEIVLMLEEFLGDPAAGPRGVELILGDRDFGPAPEASSIDGCRPEEAAAAILAAVGDRRIVIVGEEHHLPQSRSLMVPLLRGLREEGFRYFAVETFAREVAPTREAGYPTNRTGTYTADPVFADGVREAIRLGYTLVPYEAIPTGEVPAAERQSFRESGQARNIKERVLDADPDAKVFVWAGRGHAMKGAIGGDTMMAQHLKEMSGLDPFTVNASRHLEAIRPGHEPPVYRYATSKGLVGRPTVFVRPDGSPWSEGEGIDATVFFPRVRLERGRPDWMVRDLGRTPYAIPEALLGGEGLRLAQAYFAGEPDEAIPVDQVPIRPGEEVPALMLPAGKLRIRVIDEGGAVAGPIEVEI